MAIRRMFSLKVVDTDRFLEMPVSAQCLYFHLGMHADDDGFVDSPRKILRSIGCNPDDLKLLIAKQYILPFDNGVVAIAAWQVNNAIRADRYAETIYTEEKEKLAIDASGQYQMTTTPDTNGIPDGIPNDAMRDTQVRLGKDRLGKDRLDKDRIEKDRKEEERRECLADKPPARQRFSPPSVEDIRAYCNEKGYRVDPQRFVDYYTSNGWRVGKNPMKDWKAAVRMWNGKDGFYEQPGKSDIPKYGRIGTIV